MAYKLTNAKSAKIHRNKLLWQASKKQIDNKLLNASSG